MGSFARACNFWTINENLSTTALYGCRYSLGDLLKTMVSVIENIPHLKNKLRAIYRSMYVCRKGNFLINKLWQFVGSSAKKQSKPLIFYFFSMRNFSFWSRRSTFNLGRLHLDGYYTQFIFFFFCFFLFELMGW